MSRSVPETATQAEFARIANVKPGYVTQLKREGRLVLAEDGKRVNVRESRERIEATRDPSKAGVAARHAATREQQGGNGATQPAAAQHAASSAAADPDNRIGNTYQASRAVRERYLAMEAKRAYELAIGKLMDAEEVVAAVAAVTTALRTRLESLADVLGPQLAVIADEGQARAAIAEAIGHLLEEASRHFATLSTQAAP